MIQTFVRKTAQESVVNSATPQNDDHLTFSIAAGETWVVDYVLYVTGGTTGDLKAQLSVPANCSGWWGGFGMATDGLANDVMIQQVAVALGSPIEQGTWNQNPHVRLFRAVIIATDTGGSVTLQWSQRVSGSTATILLANSYLLATRMDSSDATHALVVKSADETVTNSTTLQDDDELAFDIGAGELWEATFVLFLTGETSDADVKLSASGPSGWAGHAFARSLYAAATTTSAQANFVSAAPDNDGMHRAGVIAGSTVMAEFKLLVKAGASAGTVTLRWCQYTLENTDVTVEAGSYLIATRIS